MLRPGAVCCYDAERRRSALPAPHLRFAASRTDLLLSNASFTLCYAHPADDSPLGGGGAIALDSGSLSAAKSLFQWNLAGVRQPSLDCTRHARQMTLSRSRVRARAMRLRATE